MDKRDAFLKYLQTCVKTNRSTENNPLYLGGNAPKDFRRFLESDRLFDYNPSKWVGVDLYEIDEWEKAEEIFFELNKDTDFNERNTNNNQGWRSGALGHYVCFLRAQKFFTSEITDNNHRTTLPSLPSDLPVQIIYYGAPGTGKSHKVKMISQHFETEKRVIRTTFHPDSDYSTFVGCYKPSTTDDKKIVYEFIPQAFMKAYIKAWEDTSKFVFLVIEEINRGNCAQIFGDLFQLLDRNDEGFSDYPISPDKDIQQYICKEFKDFDIANEDIKNGDIMILPANLRILATMNTSDQSLFPIDSAFKRRWEWEYVPITDAHKNYVVSAGSNSYIWWNFLEKINDKISGITNSEDKKLGYFFVKANKYNCIDSNKFVNKVIFYLYNDVFKDYGFTDPIFKNTDTNKQISFQDFCLAPNKYVDMFMKNLGVELIDLSTIEDPTGE